MCENKSNVPKLRFPGFTDAWEQRKLGDIAGQTYGGGTPKTSIDEYWTGNIPWIQSSDLSENELFGVVPRKHISEKAIAASAAKKIPENSIAIITRVGVGKLAFMPYSYASSQDFLSLSCLKMDGKFTTYQLYKKFQSELNIVQGTSIKGITKTELLSKAIMAPRDATEQRRIGIFFQRVDNLITLHRRKLGHLQEQKTGLLQKMFPKDGETIPEIRFPEFTDAWEQRKLGELLEERDIRTPQSSDYPLMAFIANEGVAPKGKRYDRSALVNDVVNKLYKRTEFGDFIYSSNNLETGSIGLNKYGKACISPVYSIFSPTGLADSDFLGKRLVRKDFINQMVKWRQGVIYGQWRIHESDFKNLVIAIPSLEEQHQIGIFFQQLDSLITLHQRKLGHLHEQKKALLQQMFI